MRKERKERPLWEEMKAFWGLPTDVHAEPMLEESARARRRGEEGRSLSRMRCARKGVRKMQVASLVMKADRVAERRERRKMREDGEWQRKKRSREKRRKWPSLAE